MKIGDIVYLDDKNKDNWHLAKWFNMPLTIKSIRTENSNLLYVISPPGVSWFAWRFKVAKIDFTTLMKYIDGYIFDKENEQKLIEFLKST